MGIFKLQEVCLVAKKTNSKKSVKKIRVIIMRKMLALVFQFLFFLFFYSQN